MRQNSELVTVSRSAWHAQVGQHPSGQHGSVQHSMNMLYMDSLQRGDQCSPGEEGVSRLRTTWRGLKFINAPDRLYPKQESSGSDNEKAKN